MDSIDWSFRRRRVRACRPPSSELQLPERSTRSELTGCDQVLGLERGATFEGHFTADRLLVAAVVATASRASHSLPAKRRDL